MEASQLKRKYIEFYKKKNHKEIKNSSLIPENDPTVLFTTAGMHPLVPFILKQKHPLGKRLVNVQRCIRTGDIESVGDDVHLTFFEMLGNWSLGDYFKEEAIKMSFEFLTSKKWLGIPVEKLGVSVFKGDKDAPNDKESAKVWLDLGVSKERIAYLSKKDNWWGPAGLTGPCGPDTEMFVWNGKDKAPRKFDIKNSGWVEVWNDVFMEYEKIKIKAILVDAMYCLFDKDRNLNKELFSMLNNYPTKLIIVTNADLNDTKNKPLTEFISDNIDIYTLKNNPDKSNPEYFEKLLNKYNLKPNEIIYFDHSEDNLNSAKKLGIKTELYKNSKQIQNFIDNNFYSYIPLKQKNVDTGMGVERTAAVLQRKETIYDTELFLPIINKIKELSEGNVRSVRIIADHLRSSVFLLMDGVLPSNLEQGYVLRRLIRTAIRHGRLIGIKEDFTSKVAEEVIKIYKDEYKELEKKKKFILVELKKEEDRFRRTLLLGLKQFDKLIKKKITGKDAFILFSTYGFPLEMTEELAKEQRLKIDKGEFEKEFRKHQELSRTATKGRFGSGLVDQSVETTKLHTATHLVHSALRKILGKRVQQKGSNITQERLRFDFSFDRKLTEEEIKKVEDLVNQQIRKGLKVIREEMPLREAKKQRALGFFEHRYGEKVYVYTIGGFSKEICTGPHVTNTQELGKFKIIKEEAVAAGIRRIKAVLK